MGVTSDAPVSCPFQCAVTRETSFPLSVECKTGLVLTGKLADRTAGLLSQRAISLMSGSYRRPALLVTASGPFVTFWWLISGRGLLL
jgi:hypothetical protein